MAMFAMRCHWSMLNNLKIMKDLRTAYSFFFQLPYDSQHGKPQLINITCQNVVYIMTLCINSVVEY